MKIWVITKTVFNTSGDGIIEPSESVNSVQAFKDYEQACDGFRKTIMSVKELKWYKECFVEPFEAEIDPLDAEMFDEPEEKIPELIANAKQCFENLVQGIPMNAENLNEFFIPCLGKGEGSFSNVELIKQNSNSIIFNMENDFNDGPTFKTNSVIMDDPNRIYYLQAEDWYGYNENKFIKAELTPIEL